jgi:hypothetical protein
MYKWVLDMKQANIVGLKASLLYFFERRIMNLMRLWLDLLLTSELLGFLTEGSAEGRVRRSP